MSGKDLLVSEGSIALTLLNVYSSLMLKTRLSTVVFDPVKLNLDNPPFDAQGIDAIIITHEHADHFDKELALEMLRRSGAPIITTPFVAQKLEGVGEKVRGLRVGESVKIKDMTFYAECCLHPANQPLSIVIKTEAVTVYHPSDSQPFTGMEEIAHKYNPDILLYMATSKRGLRMIAEKLKPKVVVSYFAPRFAEVDIPGIELKMLKQFEVYKYPYTFVDG